MLVQSGIPYIASGVDRNYAGLHQVQSQLSSACLILPFILLIFVVLSFAYDRYRCSHN